MHHMRYFHLLCILALFSCSSLKPDGPNRNLFIFIDDQEAASNKELSVTDSFLQAFTDSAGILIVSASILHNALNYTPAQGIPQSILKRFDELEALEKPDQKQLQELNNIIFSVAALKEKLQNWIVKNINTSLYMLIPKSKLWRLNLKDVDIVPFIFEDALTETELKLGLKVNHLPTITDFKNIKAQKNTVLIEDMQKIFVLNTEYATLNKKSIPQWALYIGGHGNLETVTGLPINDFKQLLSFLSAKINTRLLYYVSCYGIGSNTQFITKAIHNTYRFAILALGTSDTKVQTEGLEIKLINNKLGLFTNQRYQNLNSEMLKGQPNYATLAAYITPKDGNESDFFAQVKNPSAEFFVPVTDKTYFTLGSVSAKNKEAFLIRNPIKSILLQTDTIPNITIQTTTVPKFIPNLSGESVYRIQSISSAIHEPLKLIAAFFDSLMDSDTRRAFIIDIIKGKSDFTFRNILILKEHSTIIVYYRSGNANEFFKISVTRDTSDKYIYSNPILLTDRPELNRYDFMMQNKQFIPKPATLRHILQQSLHAAWIKSQTFLENIYTKHKKSLFTGIAALSALSAYFVIKKANQNQFATP